MTRDRRPNGPAPSIVRDGCWTIISWISGDAGSARARKGFATAAYQPPSGIDPRNNGCDYIAGAVTSALAAQHMMIDHDPRHRAARSPGGVDNERPSSVKARSGAARVPSRHHMARGWWRRNPCSSTRSGSSKGKSCGIDSTSLATYDFKLTEGQDRCGFEVYLDTDLSRPRRQYRTEEYPDFGKKFVLASAPFLVKVSRCPGPARVRFQFRAHLHQGVSPEDAIQLPYGTPVPEAFPDPAPGPQLLNADHFGTPWDDKDTKWFRLDGPQSHGGDRRSRRPSRRSQPTVTAPFGLRLVKHMPQRVEVARPDWPSGGRRHELRTPIDEGEQLYVCVFRDDLPALRRLHFTIVGQDRSVAASRRLAWPLRASSVRMRHRDGAPTMSSSTSPSMVGI